MHPIAEKIKAKSDRQGEHLDIPEWGDSENGALRIWVRPLKSRARDNFEAALFENGEDADLDNMRAKLAVRCVFDEQGQPIFTDDDAEWLGEKNAAVLDRIYDLATALSGMTKKAIEAKAKNSDAAPSG